MQILQWLFKMAAEEPPKIVSHSITSITQKQCDHEFEEEKIMPKDFVILITDQRGQRKHLKRVAKSKLSCENLILLRFFHQTLNLKGLGSFEGLKKKKKKKKRSEKRGDSATLGGNKVLPIADLSQSSSRNDNNMNQLIDSDNKAKTKNNKKKAVSRMKELLKWAATAKVLNSKEGAGSKAAVDDGIVSDESPKISFRLEMEDYTLTLRDDEIRCADTSSCSDAAVMGNWITTDSEFVVLEL